MYYWNRYKINILNYIKNYIILCYGDKLIIESKSLVVPLFLLSFSSHGYTWSVRLHPGHVGPT